MSLALVIFKHCPLTSDNLRLDWIFFCKNGYHLLVMQLLSILVKSS